MKNFKRKLSIFITLFFIVIIVGAVGAALLASSIKQEPHNMAIIWTSIIMVSLGISVTLSSAAMLYSTICQNNDAKYGYDDTNSKIFCKDGKVYCKPITDVKEITVDIIIE